MKLRAYQQEAHDSALRAWGVGPWYEADGSDLYRAILLNLATSAGKTIIAAKIIETLVGLGYRCLFIADTDELCQQANDKILSATGIKATVEKAGDKANLADAVCVASAQTLSRADRLARFAPDHFDFIICDEIHRGTDRASKIFEYFSNARICGITATAFRAKQKDLSKWFEHTAYELGTFDLIGQGYAPPIKVQTLEISMDISNVRQSAGADGQDFNATELGDTIEPYFSEIIEQIRIHAADRQILAFVPLIATSEKFVDMCNAAGIDSRHIDGKSDDREGILKAFAEKKFQLLSNASLLSTGWDCPSVDCLLCLRPTRSPGLYRQMAGRIIRTLPGTVEGLAGAEDRKAAITASAKPNCVARGSRILTNMGLVSIEVLTLAHKVWDGVSFVSHGGAICKGFQPVITYEGLTATHDHQVWTRDGWETLERVSERQIPISITGRGGNPIREAQACFTGSNEKRDFHPDVVGMPYLQASTMDATRRGYQGQDKLQREMFQGSPNSSVANRSSCSNETEMPEPKRCSLPWLRRKGNRIQVSVSIGSGGLDTAEPWSASNLAVGSNRQRRSLRTRKSPVVNPAPEFSAYKENSELCETAQDEVRVSRRHVCRFDVKQDVQPRDDSFSDSSPILQYAIDQTEREVWDILNCGPLHRFTCEGLLVHNCLILDPLWLSGQFELSGPVSLIAEDEEEADALAAKVRKATGTPQELEELRRQVQAEREERLRERLERAAKEAGMNKQGLIDAGAFGYLLHNRRLIKYTPAMASDELPITDLQIKWLTQSKIDPATVTCSGHARAVLNAAWDRKKNGLCPVVMLWRLSLRGITGAESMTVAQAEDAAGDCLWSFGKKAGTPFSEFTQRDIAFWRGFMADKPDMIARFPKEAAFVGAA